MFILVTFALCFNARKYDQNNNLFLQNLPCPSLASPARCVLHHVDGQLETDRARRTDCRGADVLSDTSFFSADEVLTQGKLTRILHLNFQLSLNSRIHMYMLGNYCSKLGQFFANNISLRAFIQLTSNPRQ